ncbi:MAG: hypothetical protein V7L23_06850, partial [Nostoc sp.]|uniref:hypothetical protein n=1 Tax=Nostoc sp. TaxID=1180 RepID=UPI002FEEBA43
VSLGSLSAIAQGYFSLHFPINDKSSKTGCSPLFFGSGNESIHSSTRLVMVLSNSADNKTNL